MMPGKETGFIEFHPQVQPCLPSQGRQHTVRLFFLYNLLQNFYVQRLNIYFIRNIPVRHDSGRVGIHQHHFDSFLFQGTTGLCSRIVKLRRLSNHNRPRANHKHFFHIWIFRHFILVLLPASPGICQTNNRNPEAPGRLPDGTVR